MTINNMAAVIPIASLVAVAVLAALLCYCVVLRKLLSGSTPAETVLRSIREAFILVDANAGFLSANESAARLFPPLKTLKTGAPIAGVENWPAGLHTPADTCDSPPTMFSLYSRYYSASVSRVTARKRPSPGYAILIQDITEAAHLTKEDQGNRIHRQAHRHKQPPPLHDPRVHAGREDEEGGRQRIHHHLRPRPLQ